MNAPRDGADPPGEEAGADGTPPLARGCWTWLSGIRARQGRWGHRSPADGQGLGGSRILARRGRRSPGRPCIMHDRGGRGHWGRACRRRERPLYANRGPGVGGASGLATDCGRAPWLGVSQRWAAWRHQLPAAQGGAGGRAPSRRGRKLSGHSTTREVGVAAAHRFPNALLDGLHDLLAE